MAKFFETLINKFFDFFNFGRFLTIIIPGLIVAVCAAMFFSQAIFPVGSETPAPGGGATVELSQETSKETINEDGKLTVKETTKATTKGAGGEASTQAEPLILSDKERFQRQVTDDLARIGRNFFPVILMTIVFGMMIYEVGFWFMLCSTKDCPHDPKNRLCWLPRLFGGGNDISYEEMIWQYQDDHDSLASPAQKFRRSGERASFIYFAPFLKDKFSGEDNFFAFFNTEYYRFLEFCVVMPLSIVISNAIVAFYYLLFVLRVGANPYSDWFWLMVFMPSALALLFLYLVYGPILAHFRQSRRQLIDGISHFMSKRIGEK